MPTILVDDASTYPSAIEAMVADSVDAIESCLAGKNLSLHSTWQSFEPHVRYKDKNIANLYIRILSQMEEKQIEGFHNTRVLNKENIKSKGLLLLTPDSTIPTILSVLQMHGISLPKQHEVDAALRYVIDGSMGGRREMLSFFTPYSLSQAYGQFANNIGGEVCERALSTRYPEVFSILKSNGYPITVKFIFSFSNIAAWYKDVIIFAFIRFFAAKLLAGYDYPPEFDGMLTSPVTPDQILELIEFPDSYQE